MMSWIKQSDAAILLLNAAHKEVRVSAESNEGRAAIKGILRSHRHVPYTETGKYVTSG